MNTLSAYLPIVIFWAIAALTAGSAVVVVTSRNVLHAAFALCMSFLGVAGLYVYLHADFVAAVQLIVYVGGILVLIMFAVMFSSNVTEDTAEKGRGWGGIIAGLAVAGAIFASLFKTIMYLNEPLQKAATHGKDAFAATVAPDAPGQTALGHLMMGRYVLPFEFVSVLLLAALIGAVVIIRKEINQA